MAVALVAVILVSVHPVFASAAEEPVQGVAEGNISLSVPATTLPCALQLTVPLSPPMRISMPLSILGQLLWILPA